ncbi:MAG: MFS transporter, partial [Candidatus Bathyarchaeia archaeon]
MLGFGLVMPLLPIYARDFGATGVELGFLTASFAVTRAITTFPGGWLADKSGRKTPIVTGLLAYSVVMTLYGFSQDVNQLILLRALQGMASGIVWPVISTMVADVTSPQDRGKAMGLYEMMWFLGMVVGPGLGGALADAFTDATPFFVCGVLAFISMALVVFRVQETAKNVNKNKRGQAETETETETETERKPNPEPTNATKNGFLKNLTPYPKVFVCLCLVGFIVAFSHSLIQPVLSVFAYEELAISRTDIGILFTAMAISMLITILPSGTVADRIGRKTTLALGVFLDAISAALIIISGSFWPLLLVMMLRGLGRAASDPPLIAMFSSLVPTVRRGKSMGVFNSFRNVGLVAGSALGGFLYEAFSPESSFILCAIAGLVGVALVLLTISEPKKGLQ